jgi:hypothetical protein
LFGFGLFTTLTPSCFLIPAIPRPRRFMFACTIANLSGQVSTCFTLAS